MSNPITLVATVTVNPSARSAVEAALVEAVASTLDEPGCEQYDLHRDARDPNRFLVLERWHDQASLDAHAAVVSFTALTAVLKDHATLQVTGCIPFSPSRQEILR
jgi:quinol monooxygenase YgiN